MSPGGAFLTARWEYLAMLNYAVDPALLRPLVPRGTTLDLWNGAALVSLVGFRFLDTRLLGVPVPGHRDFEEVNLRFYVRRQAGPDDERRAVVFIRELVPRPAIAWVARACYNEPYLAVPMSHAIAMDHDRGMVEYGWAHRSREFSLRVEVEGPPEPLVRGTEAEFVTEHFWGYTRQRDGGTLEYRVTHPSWRLWHPRRATFTGRADLLYGAVLGEALAGRPQSAFLAEGSAVTVGWGRRLLL